MTRVRDVQSRLAELGFNPGPVDGIRGRLTIVAVKAFQRSRNLVVDGIVGPITSTALFEGRPERDIDVDAMPWFDEAKRLIGTKEIVGSKHNPLIIGWGKSLKLWYPRDEIAWCGLFVAHCIGSQMPDEALPKNPLGARNWTKFGKHCEPQVGSILVFWRGSKSGWKGHVGFYHAEDRNAYHVLGGNQSNAVNVRRISKSRLLDSRWPFTGLEPGNKVQKADMSGKLSTNEA